MISLSIISITTKSYKLSWVTMCSCWANICQDCCFDVQFSNIQADCTKVYKLFIAIKKAHPDKVNNSFEKIERLISSYLEIRILKY